ncbi:MAG: TlpA family protein disulfide reductase [Planctomycetia bacterium]|nr:TlpA family protein disulfide reductase [Planctomycetia bacterium]
MLLAFVTTGCDPPATTTPATPPPSNTAVTLRPADEKDLAALVTKHRGQVVLVDCWATWCPPCMKQFPHTVALGEKYRPQGLVVVSLSFNEPDDSAAVLAFLSKQHATFDNLVSRYGSSQQSYAAFDIQSGALPYYILFDRAGVRHDTPGPGPTDELLGPANLDRAIEKFLAEPATGAAAQH